MRIRKGSLNYWLLLALEKAVDGAIRLDDYIYHPYKYMQGPNIAPAFKKSSLVEAVRRLREGDLVTREKNQGEIVLKLTALGREYLRKEEEWDGKYRVVVWDIPENKRKLRNLLRRRLKEWGFKLWQRSVWVSKANVTGKMRKLISELDLTDWVAIIESEDSFFHIIWSDRSK